MNGHPSCRTGCGCPASLNQSPEMTAERCGGEQAPAAEELVIDVLRAEVVALTRQLVQAERERDALAEMLKTLCETLTPPTAGG